MGRDEPGEIRRPKLVTSQAEQPKGEAVSWPGELEQNAQTPPASHTASPAAAAYRVPANLDQAIASLPLERRTASAPRHIGYLVNYKFHIWYQILMEVMRRRSGMYDAVLKVVDFQQNVATQIEAARKLLPDVER